MVDFHEIWYGDNAIQGDLGAIIFNPISSTVWKWLKLKLNLQPCSVMVWDWKSRHVFYQRQ
jgi:hypothetical protein